MSEVPLQHVGGDHTVDYGTFIKSQLAYKQLSLGPYVMQMWSRPPKVFLKPS